MPDKGTPFVFLDDNIQKRLRYYSAPVSIITAYDIDDIKTAFAKVEAALSRGHYVAGYASYELGLGLDKKLSPLFSGSNPRSPLLCFGVFEGYADDKRPIPSTQAPLPALTPDWNEADYLSRFDKLKTYIEAGDIYQANLTFPYSGHSPDAPDFPYLYEAMRGRQPVRYGGMVSLEGPDILSLSPELFFKIEGVQISARPMKGTAPRSNDPTRDAKIGADMLADEKSRAENLMIVDLLRNDLSRISMVGSVEVTDLFTLETFPTLHQMTSGITARVKENVSVTDVFKTLYPCGSVTGAPKIRAMEIIDALESGPRGPYCGAIGYFDPNGDCSFNVAIRTLTSKANKGGGYDLAYHVGSGVVADSIGAAEYAECQLKSNILTKKNVIDYDLRETLLWTPKEGYWLFEGHMIRLMRSAKSLGFTLDMDAVQSALDKAVTRKTTQQRVSLSLSVNGDVSVTTLNLKQSPSHYKLHLSKVKIDSSDSSLAYKSTQMRRFYDTDRARILALTPCDEVIYINENSELCEGSFTNIFAQIDGLLYTPPLSCGLLPGVLRAHLLETGDVKTRKITVSDLSRASAIYVGNSVRGLCKATLLNATPL